MTPHTTTCPACKGSMLFRFPARDYISSHVFAIYGCDQCGLGQTAGGPEGASLMEYYGARYYGKRKGFVGGLINRARIRIVRKALKGISHPLVLDVGCGNGSLIAHLRERGIEATGTEVAPPEHFQKSALPFIRLVDFKNSGFEAGSADVIMLWHVLEHLEEGEKYLAEAARVLKRGGSLIIEVPNYDSWQAKLFKANSLHLDVPRHVLHFSVRSMTLFLQHAGFTTFRFKGGSLIYGYFGAFQSLLNAVSTRKNLFFDLLNGKIGFRTLVTNHPKDVALNGIFFIPALIVGGILLIAESIAGKSGIMLVVAQK